MSKNYRKIIVNNREYDWLYVKSYDRHDILIYNIEYKYDEYLFRKIRKRRFFKKYNIIDFCEDAVKNINITPDIARKFIEYKPGTGGYIITRKYLRKLKLLNINEKDR